jgi:p24 family protein gamma-2
MNHHQIPILTVFLACIICTSGLEKEMTVNIDAGKRECFYESAKMGQTIDIEYQVIDGSHGDLDISFELSELSGRILFADFKKSENIHRHEVKTDGDYRFCFDNTFSNFNTKTVFFELIIEFEDEQRSQENFDNDLFEGLTAEEFYEVKVQDIQESIGRVKAHLIKARQLQDHLRSHEARDRNIAEENYFKVNVWSLFQMLMMIAVGGLQVVMVRSLFDTNSKVHKIWGKFS